MTTLSQITEPPKNPGWFIGNVLTRKDKIMGRGIFFALHFMLGFLVLWLIYQSIQHSVLPGTNPALWLEAAVETAYLVTGVIWGNLGWDTFKKIPEKAKFSLMIYVLSRTLAPVVIVLPIFLIVLDMFFLGKYLSWRLALTWQNWLLVVFAVVGLILLGFYRKSEMGFFYRAWRV